MTAVRVTQNLLAQRSVASLQAGMARMARAQEQVSTGHRVNRASDDATAATQAMSLKAGIAQQQAYARNAEDGLGWLGTVDTTLSGMSDGIRLARELGLQGASSGTTSASSRAALASQVDQLRASLVSQANTTYLGRPVLGGLTPGEVAFDADGTYVGIPGEVNRTVGEGVTVRVDVSGPAVVGPTTPGGTTLFDDLDALSAALTAGDDTAVRAAVGSLATRLETVATVRAGAGAAYNRVEAANQAAQDAVLGLRSRLSSVQDADLPQAYLEVQLQEVAYQAALAATARVVQPSLVSFLR